MCFLFHFSGFRHKSHTLSLSLSVTIPVESTRSNIQAKTKQEEKSPARTQLLANYNDFLVMIGGDLKLELTWLPNTPILQADDTWSGPNHTAATRAGSDRINTWSDCGLKE